AAAYRIERLLDDSAQIGAYRPVLGFLHGELALEDGIRREASRISGPRLRRSDKRDLLQTAPHNPQWPGCMAKVHHVVHPDVEDGAGPPRPGRPPDHSHVFGNEMLLHLVVEASRGLEARDIPVA